MPTPTQILEGLARAAMSMQWLAVLWHIVLALVLIALARGFRPSARHASLGLALLALSVGVVSWITRNPFNGLFFLLLAGALAFMGAKQPPQVKVARGPAWSAALGGLMIGFGAVYPHFLGSSSPWLYLVAAPLGIVPCATLSAIVGFELLGGGLRSRLGTLIVAAAGFFYGVVGAFRLNVWIDLALLAGSAALLALAILAFPRPAASMNEAAA